MTRPGIIEKTAADLRVRPHWSDYEAGRQAFRWSQARAAMQGLPGGALNMVFEAVDRQAGGPLKDKTALRFVQRAGPALEFTFGELARRSKQFAHVLRALGLAQGDTLFVLGRAHPRAVCGGAGRPDAQLAA